MDHSSDWHGSVSFSDRINNISRIAIQLEKIPGHSAAEARQQAKEVEKNICSQASSLEEYNIKCAIATEPSTSNLSSEQPDDNMTEEFSSDVSIGKYKHVKNFRDGLFSFVYKAYAPSDAELDFRANIVALKVTTPSLMEKPHDSEREARILDALRHHRVIPLFDVFRQPGGQLVLVFPFMPFDLHRLLRDRNLDQKQVKNHLRDMFEALKFIHAHGCIHRDIKPSNLLLKTVSGPAYLADFGIAWSSVDPTSEPSDEKITDVGTTCYRPPELLFGNRQYGCSLDLWAAGCTVAEADSLSGQTLFDSGDLGSELALIRSIFSSLGTPTSETWPEAKRFPDWGKMEFREYPQLPWTELLPAATVHERSLVERLIKFESGERLTASEALNHPYFSTISS